MANPSPSPVSFHRPVAQRLRTIQDQLEEVRSRDFNFLYDQQAQPAEQRRQLEISIASLDSLLSKLDKSHTALASLQTQWLNSITVCPDESIKLDEQKALSDKNIDTILAEAQSLLERIRLARSEAVSTQDGLHADRLVVTHVPAPTITIGI